jgi:phosphatidylserine decarboxylase
MLHRNMNPSPSLQLSLEDLLADLGYARRRGDLGRLALIAYCEVRRWARQAGEAELAEHSAAMITESPHVSRQAFLQQVDGLIVELEEARAHFQAPRAPGLH